ncbi:MAG: hypothetical protein ABIK82_22680 [Pseudomonadota bacterium]
MTKPFPTRPTVAEFLADSIALINKTQAQIAAECGFESANVITMFKKGQTKLPINRVGPLAKALNVDPAHLLRLVLLEYLPDTWENRLRLQHAETDRAFEAKVARKKADRKRRDEFIEQIREIDTHTFKLTRGLIVQVAYSEIRCTIKEHEYFDANNDSFKQLIADTAKSFEGRYNKSYGIWEFKPPPNKVFALYRKLVTSIEQRLAELTKPQEPKATPAPPPEIHRQFRDDDERELFDEIAATQEFEAGRSRDEAERTAFVEILKRRVRVDQSSS